MAPVYRDDPYGAFNFRVEVAGISDDGEAARGAFSEVSGLEVELDVIEYRNGSEDITPRKLSGLAKYSNLVLKRGITGDLALWNWILSGISGKPFRTNMTVVLLDEERNEVMRWTFKRAWPCKWTGPDLNAVNNEIAIETLEIAHEGMRIDGDGG